jgi:hypothetical protein
MLPTEPPSSANGFQALLKNKSFLALWIGQLLSQVADKVFFILLIALLENYQPAAGMKNSMRSTLMIAFTLPAIFFGSAGGIFCRSLWEKASAGCVGCDSRLTNDCYPLAAKTVFHLIGSHVCNFDCDTVFCPSGASGDSVVS